MQTGHIVAIKPWGRSGLTWEVEFDRGDGVSRWSYLRKEDCPDEIAAYKATMEQVSSTEPTGSEEIKLKNHGA